MKKLLVRSLSALALLSGAIYLSTIPQLKFNPTNEIVIDGEVGDVITHGDLVFEILNPSLNNNINTRDSLKAFNLNLSGTKMTEAMTMSTYMSYFKVYVKAYSGSGDIRFSITKFSPAGPLVNENTQATIKAGNYVVISNKNSPNKNPGEDLYYANFVSSNKAMHGTASTKVASSVYDLGL